MKNLSYMLAIAMLVLLAPEGMAQTKLKKKDAVFGKPFSHKKIWKQEKWIFNKFTVHYKVISTELALGGKKDQNVSARSWAMLDGVSEETMQRITDNFADKFQKRMKDEFGITVEYWDHIKSSPNTQKILEKEDEKLFTHKGNGAMIGFTKDNGPWYRRVGAFLPGGRKLAKEFGAATCELDVIVDFAAFETTINTNKDWGWDYTLTTTNVQQGIVPMVFVTPNMVASAGQTRAVSHLTGTDANGMMMMFNAAKTVEAGTQYSTGIEPHKGEMPALMKRKFNLAKPNMISTFVVNADEAKYEAAVNEALDRYLDALVEAIKAEKK